MRQSPAQMTLGNMRANGVRTLAVWCLARGCGHQRVIDVERYGDDVPVPWFGPRLRCGRDAGPRGLPQRHRWDENNFVVMGSRFDATLDDIEEYFAV